MKIVMLAGGVGGARMARGFAAMTEVETTIVANVGDDDSIYGLHISPDIDTIVYSLAGVEGSQGWGRADDTWRVMAELERFGVDTSFRLGDMDLALNLFRTQRLTSGTPLSEITRMQAEAFDVPLRILPVTDDRLRTQVQTESTGVWLDFQTYFVRRRHQDRVAAVRFDGAGSAAPAPGVLAAIGEADAVVIAPSNPVLSIWPILAVDGIREALGGARVMAVSPLIGGKALKGPAADVMASLGLPSGTEGVIAAYDGLLDDLIVDASDVIEHPDVRIIGTDTRIPDWERARRLAKEMVGWLT